MKDIDLFHIYSPDTNQCGVFSTQLMHKLIQKSCYGIGYICPIRAEISTYEHWENVFILIFVWLVVIGFRQNHIYIVPNFRDLGAKMSFFSLYNQPKTEKIYKTLFPRCSKTPLISEMCIYITHNLCKWGFGTPGGTMFYRLKMGVGHLTAHEIPL